MARILLVEDEADLRRVLVFNLLEAGHQPIEAEGGLEGLRLARQHRPELVLLDLMLPDLSGQEVCRALKAHAATQAIPVIMLTARGEVDDRVRGLELGAEDYVIKPFSVREVLLRMAAVLRRKAGADLAAASELRCGPVRIDASERRAYVDDREVALSTQELRLLERLLEFQGRDQPRAALTDAVWGAGADVEDEQLDSMVARLRQRLGAAGCRLERATASGYRFRKADG